MKGLNMKIAFDNSFEGFLDGLYKLYKQNFKGDLIIKDNTSISHENSYIIKKSIIHLCGEAAYDEFKKVFFSKSDSSLILLSSSFSTFASF